MRSGHGMGGKQSVLPLTKYTQMSLSPEVEALTARWASATAGFKMAPEPCW